MRKPVSRGSGNPEKGPSKFDCKVEENFTKEGILSWALNSEQRLIRETKQGRAVQEARISHVHRTEMVQGT